MPPASQRMKPKSSYRCALLNLMYINVEYTKAGINHSIDYLMPQFTTIDIIMARLVGSLSFHNPKTISVGARRPYMSLRAPTLDPLNDQEARDRIPDPEEAENEYQPVVDAEVPKVIAMAVTQSYSNIDESDVIQLPPLPPVNDASFEMLLAAKLEVCSQVMDFTNRDAQTKQKEEKAKALIELISYFENTREAKKLNGKLQRAIFRMIELNVLRVDPKFPSSLETGDYTLSVIEPAWPHLFFCHQLLTRFVNLFPEAEFVNFSVVKRALFLTQLPDANERVHLVNFLKAYYDTHVNDRLDFIRSLRDRLILLAEVPLVPLCGMPLLLCANHVLSRGLTDPEVREVYKDMIKQAVVPLFGHTHMSLFYSSFKSLLVLSIKEIPELTSIVLKGLQNKWPVAGGMKEQLATDLVITISSTLSQSDFSLFSANFFVFLARRMYSPNYKVVNTILSMYSKEDLRKFVKDNSTLLIDKLYVPFHEAAENSWCHAIREKAAGMIEMMSMTSPAEFQKKRLAIKTREANAKKAKNMYIAPLPPEDNRPLRKWTQITKLAVSEWPDIDEKEMIVKITDVCVLEPDLPKRHISHFMPFHRRHGWSILGQIGAERACTYSNITKIAASRSCRKQTSFAAQLASNSFTLGRPVAPLPHGPAPVNILKKLEL